MATYREFREQVRRRKRKRMMQRLMLFGVTFLVILALAAVIVKIIGPEEPEVGEIPADPMAASSEVLEENGEEEHKEEHGEEGSLDTGIPVQFEESVLAPLPMENVEAGDQSWNSVGPVEQTLDFSITAPDYRMLSVPANGIVDMSYFNTVTFLGDSISQSFDAYMAGEIGGTKVASIGAGPQTVVNGVAVALHRGGEPVNMLDSVVASQPDNVYVLMGTNTLVNTGNEEQFLAYYGKMLDMLKESLDPRVKIYVQSITPVQESNPTVQGKAGLRNDRLRAINSQLAALAVEKGCYFLDIQEVFADESGNLRADLCAADGIHLNKQGTHAWVDYLSTHTVYDKRTPYLYGSPYYIEG